MNNKVSLCILCEGYEEYDYLEKLISKDVFHDNYKIKLVNAKGIENIYARYCSLFRQDNYHVVLIFCDTDKKDKGTYWKLKEKINCFHDCIIDDKIIIFGNPCTMQIILSHFSKVSLKSPSKKVNSKLIEQLTGIKDYNATNEERKKLMQKITKSNYYQMKDNLKEISDNA